MKPSRPLMSQILLDMSDEDILQGVSAVYSQKLWVASSGVVQSIALDVTLYDQALHLIRCDMDRMMAQLTWEGY